MNSLTKAVALYMSIGCFSIGLSSAAMADSLTFSSSAFPDNGLMGSKYAGKGGPRKCDGENIAPALQWSNPPKGTKSFAIVMTDAVGREGLGVDHWTAYGIPADVRSMEEGEGNSTDTFVGGLNIIKKGTYLGPCPNVGDQPHHYEFMLVALDLTPDSLKPGLSREALFKAIQGHNLEATSFVGRYARSK